MKFKAHFQIWMRFKNHLPFTKLPTSFEDVRRDSLL